MFVLQKNMPWWKIKEKRAKNNQVSAVEVVHDLLGDATNHDPSCCIRREKEL